MPVEWNWRRSNSSIATLQTWARAKRNWHVFFSSMFVYTLCPWSAVILFYRFANWPIDLFLCRVSTLKWHVARLPEIEKIARKSSLLARWQWCSSSSSQHPAKVGLRAQLPLFYCIEFSECKTNFIGQRAVDARFSFASLNLPGKLISCNFWWAKTQLGQDLWAPLSMHPQSRRSEHYFFASFSFEWEPRSVARATHFHFYSLRFSIQLYSFSSDDGIPRSHANAAVFVIRKWNGKERNEER